MELGLIVARARFVIFGRPLRELVFVLLDRIVAVGTCRIVICIFILPAHELVGDHL